MLPSLLLWLAQAAPATLEPQATLDMLGASGQPWSRVQAGASLHTGGAGPRSLLWRAQASGYGRYTPRSGSAGGEARLGLYAGPERRLWRTEYGPSLFYNGYGSPTAPDYYLRRTLGLNLHTQLSVPIKALTAHAWADPGWVRSADRWADLWLIQEFTTGVGVELPVQRYTLRLNAQWTWNYSGMQRSLALTLSMPFALGADSQVPSA